MARARKNAKTPAQHVMGAASMTLPAPLRAIVTTRWGARLSLIVAAALIGSGVISLQWTDGKPHVQIDRQRAAEVEQKFEQRVERFEAEHGKNDRKNDRMTNNWNSGDLFR